MVNIAPLKMVALEMSYGIVLPMWKLAEFIIKFSIEMPRMFTEKIPWQLSSSSRGLEVMFSWNKHPWNSMVQDIFHLADIVLIYHEYFHNSQVDIIYIHTILHIIIYYSFFKIHICCHPWYPQVLCDELPKRTQFHHHARRALSVMTSTRL